MHIPLKRNIRGRIVLERKICKRERLQMENFSLSELAYLILRVKKLELVVDQAVFGRFFFAKSSLLLQFGAPKSLNTVHA